MKISFVATQAVSNDISSNIISRLCESALQHHQNNEWFLVFKPIENGVKIEDGNNNILSESDFTIPRNLYSIHDKLEEGHVITLLYPEEY